VKEAGGERRYGVVPREQMLAMSGLEFLRSIVDGSSPAPPITQTLNYRLVEVREGFAAFEGEPDFSVYNPLGLVHGGYALTLLDSVLGCAVQSTLAKGVGYTTIETKVNFLRPITKDTGRVRVEGRIVHAGRRTGLAEGDLKDAAGRVLAYGTSTCLIFSADG
jgi:uncharacterized protein (TIGR00369 family)